VKRAEADHWAPRRSTVLAAIVAWAPLSSPLTLIRSGKSARAEA